MTAFFQRDRTRQILLLAGPIIGGMTSQMVLNVVDAAMRHCAGDVVPAALRGHVVWSKVERRREVGRPRKRRAREVGRPAAGRSARCVGSRRSRTAAAEAAAAAERARIRGCYLCFSEVASGTLQLVWSESAVEGALAHFTTAKTVPQHKFATNQGR